MVKDGAYDKASITPTYAKKYVARVDNSYIKVQRNEVKNR